MPADLLLGGGAVLGHERLGHDAVVAVAGDRIVAVGGSEVADLAGPRTRRVDLAGGLLVPGFVDAHIHPVQGGLERMRCDLSQLQGRDTYLRAIRSYADAHPEREWITGGGWGMASFPGGTPVATDLDAVLPDRPVFLPNRDHHGAWVNTCALDRAGIVASTPDPPDGRIERASDGSPTGLLHEGAMTLVGHLLPSDTEADHVAALLEAQAYLHSLGITGWQDAILGSYANLGDASAAYLRTARDGRLTARVVGALWWDRDRGNEQIAELVERRDRLRTGRFAATSVKIMQDGIAENFTAAMLDAYLDRSGAATGNRGLSFVDPETLSEAVPALDAAGFQVHVHAIGDRAVREALDAFAVARAANGATDARHHIAHIQVIAPPDVPRFAALDVAANMQALWAAHEPQMDEMTIPFLGAERTGWQYPFASLARSGARLAAGSDWPVSSPDPLQGIHTAVNRVQPDAPVGTEPFLPEQALEVSAALAAYTAGSAWVNHSDATGHIDVGMLADLAVLDRDILAGPAEAVADARVVATYVGGRQVHAG